MDSENQISQFYNLTPDLILEAVERAGFFTTGEYLQLNSYENRVFDLFLEPESEEGRQFQRVVAKFYRPLRWSEDAIAEEHEFLGELKDNDLQVVAPLKQANGRTLSQFRGLWVALFPKFFGRLPDEMNLAALESVGQILGRLHNIGAAKVARHRPQLTPEHYGWKNLAFLKSLVPVELWSRYENAAHVIFEFLEQELKPNRFIRLHGDCHRGNLLRTDPRGLEAIPEYFLVDFDDFCNGPAVQDFWMLLSGDWEESEEEIEALLLGYERFRSFDREELHLIDGLRGLRIVHYAAWIGRRWEDPIFPHYFPQYREFNYWAEETEALERVSFKLS